MGVVRCIHTLLVLVTGTMFAWCCYIYASISSAAFLLLSIFLNVGSFLLWTNPMLIKSLDSFV